jgi:cardiolipin synthase A/B
MSWAVIDVILLYVVQVLTMFRAITRENREAASRVAWMIVILALPVLGVLLYFLLGEVSFGRRTFERMQGVIARLPVAPADGEGAGVTGDEPLRRLPPLVRGAFGRAAAVNGFRVTEGNRAELLAGEDEAIDRLVADIDAARDHVHLLFYIWLTDGNGRKVLDALSRAARRGVTCRCLVDGLGSRQLVASPEWAELAASGAKLGVAFDTRWPALRLVVGRIDIRNHRKIVVIDGQITYCGSQNCADPAFLIKKKYAPWVDVMLRLDGPIAWQQQQLFAADWMSHTDEDIAAVLDLPVGAHPDGFPAIAVGSGPNISFNSIPDVFTLALAAAQDEVVITTPYYVPSTAVQAELRSTALRGVRVTMIVPGRNDSRFVALASHSFYRQLLVAGVRLFQYQPGLLHAKTLTVDGELCFMGSANLDRRSFELNFENNVLLHDRGLTLAVRDRQRTYMSQSHEIRLADVDAWPWPRRLVNNIVGTLGPVL